MRFALTSGKCAAPASFRRSNSFLNLVIGLLLGTAAAVLGAEERLPILHAGQRFYTNVIVTQKTPTDLFIMHEGGMATVKVRDLDSATRSRLGMKPSDPSAGALENSPEHRFGLRLEEAMRTNGYSLITQAFDLDLVYRRVVATLPLADAVKESIQANPKSGITRNMLLKNVVAGDGRVRFLGLRRFENETELLFRTCDHRYHCSYTGYVTTRQPAGTILLIDEHDLSTGELMSQTIRREFLIGLIEKRLISGTLTARDKAFVSGLEAWKLFVSRCEYGKFDLIREAYQNLPSELQNDRFALSLYARSGEKSIKELLVPIEHWRTEYPGDPAPELMVVDFYWRLYEGPRLLNVGVESSIHTDQSWSPEEEAQAASAIQRANVWFADPAMEVRLARHYGTNRLDKAKPLLQQAIQRFPLEKQTLAEMLHVDLAANNFNEIGRTLRLEEVTFQTNLTPMVDATPAYTAFRRSFAWKKWQHDYHGVDVKTLIAPMAPQQGK